jgi:hypothetical protein
MKVIKIILSVIALLVAATASAMTGGLFHVAPAVIGIVTAAGVCLGYVGIAPFQLDAVTDRIVSGVALLLGALTAWHASVVTVQFNSHPWIWQIVGTMAILAGVVGKSPIVHVPPTAADGPLIGGKPPLDGPVPPSAKP